MVLVYLNGLLHVMFFIKWIYRTCSDNVKLHQEYWKLKILFTLVIKTFLHIYYFTFLFQLIEYAIGTALTTQLNFTSSSLLISIWFNFSELLPTIVNLSFGISMKKRKRIKRMIGKNKSGKICFSCLTHHIIFVKRFNGVKNDRI